MSNPIIIVQRFDSFLHAVRKIGLAEAVPVVSCWPIFVNSVPKESMAVGNTRRNTHSCEI
jgi:hypothetical protein